MAKRYSCNGLDLCDKCRSEIRGEKTHASSLMHGKPFDGERAYFQFHPGCNPIPERIGTFQSYDWNPEEYVHENALEAVKEKHERITA